MEMLLVKKTSLMKFIKEIQSLVPSQLQRDLETTLVVFSMTKQVEKILITISALSAGEYKMVLNIGLLETHGEAIGEKEETLD